MDALLLTRWLAQGADFAAGVALYEAHGGASPMCRRLFALGASATSRRVLERELRALADAPPAPSTSAARAPSAELLAARAQLRARYDERTRLHSQMSAPRLARKARGEMAFRILDLTQEIEALRVLTEQLATGTVPVVKPTDPRQRLSNLLSQRTKLKKRPDRAADLAAVEAEIALIRSSLPS